MEACKKKKKIVGITSEENRIPGGKQWRVSTICKGLGNIEIK